MNESRYVSPEIEIVVQSVNDIMTVSDGDDAYSDIGNLWGNNN